MAHRAPQAVHEFVRWSRPRECPLLSETENLLGRRRALGAEGEGSDVDGLAAAVSHENRTGHK